MTDGNTLIVDVVSSGDGYMLNDTPVNMMIAYEVVRRHVTDNGTFYSQMTKKQKTAEGYVFKFDTGDEFTCTSDTAHPTASSISDDAPSSGGGVLVVTDTDGTLDKTWQEIHDSAPLVWQTDGDGGYMILSAVYEDDGDFGVTFTEPQPNGNHILLYVATSASGYPVYVET